MVKKVIWLDTNKFFNAHPQCSVCVKVKFSRDLKELVEIQIGGTTFTQKVPYLKLSITFYQFQSMEHKIKCFSFLECNHLPIQEAKITLATKKYERTNFVKKVNAPLWLRQGLCLRILVILAQVWCHENLQHLFSYLYLFQTLVLKGQQHSYP